MNFFLLLNTNEDILKKQLLVATDFHRMKKLKNTMEVNGYQLLSGYQHSSKILFCVQQKTEIDKDLKQHKTE